MKRLFFLCLLSLTIQLTFSQTGNKSIDLQSVVEGKFAQKSIGDIQSLPDGEHYTRLSEDGTLILKYAYKTGKIVDTLFNVKTVRETQLDKIEGYLISSTGFRIIVWKDKEYVYRRSWKANIYDYDVRRNFLKPLSDTSGKLMAPLISPDGRMCAFVRDNNIWLKKYDYDTESQVTKDGVAGKIINGITDWVYEEEFVQTSLMSWSPDSKFLSFVRFDETQVPTFDFQVFDGSLYPALQSFKYPKAGQNNSVVTCHSYSVETKDIKKMAVPLDADGYIPLIKYTETIDQLAVMTLNRQQNIFCMYYVNPRSGLAKMVLKEENQCYIDSDLLKYITFTKDNFIYVSEKSGFTHIYLYSAAGVLQKQLTSGNWDVTAFYGSDPATHTVYYQSAEESPLQRAVYRIDEKGVKTRLSVRTGTNAASFNNNCNYFINRYSNVSTPALVTINDNKGKELSVLEDNQQLVNILKQYQIGSKEFFKFTNSSGVELNGWMIKPTAFSASQKYPVLMVQYSGPNSQSALDKYSLDWEEYMAAQGYLVVCIDGRGTGARGEQFRKCTYQNLGIIESDDQIAGANYLASLSYVDKKRIAIWGWSYGGTITLLSMSRSNGIFKAGISIAPVTDWKLYNTIYTERYMRTPKENFIGYKQTSLINMASNLQGKLLLVHGTSDDNVHYQNTLYYANGLIEAGKLFDMQIYPNKNHSLLGETTRLHLYHRLTRFLEDNL